MCIATKHAAVYIQYQPKCFYCRVYVCIILLSSTNFCEKLEDESKVSGNYVAGTSYSALQYYYYFFY